MAITGVMRPGHAAIRVLELEPAVAYYTDTLGLMETGRDEQGRVYFKCWDEHDAYSVIVHEADSPGLEYMGFRVDSEATLDALAGSIEGSGLATDLKWMPAGELRETGRRFQFRAPSGHLFELFASKTAAGIATGDLNPAPWPDGLRGMSPTHFDHCALSGTHIQETVRLFCDVLGFKVAEEIIVGEHDQEQIVGSFLTCSNKPHDVAFLAYPEPGKLHHMSFGTQSWSDLLRAADIISKKDVMLDIGPTRHGVTRGQTIYFFDPSGNRNEVFAGGYLHYPDRPKIRWTGEESPRYTQLDSIPISRSVLSV